MEKELIAYLNDHCHPIDETDDALVYKVDKIMQGRFPSLKKAGATHIYLYEDNTYSLETLNVAEPKSGALLREFARPDAV